VADAVPAYTDVMLFFHVMIPLRPSGKICNPSNLPGGVKKLNFWEKRSFARKDGSLGETLGRHLLHLNSKGFNSNNPEDLVPRKGALLMTSRDSKVLERDPS
jgi:hypothetical protein